MAEGEDHVGHARRGEARREGQHVVPDAPVGVRDGGALLVGRQGLLQQLGGRLGLLLLLLLLGVGLFLPQFGFRILLFPLGGKGQVLTLGRSYLAVQAPEGAAEVAPRPGVLAAGRVRRAPDGPAEGLGRLLEVPEAQADVAEAGPHVRAEAVGARGRAVGGPRARQVLLLHQVLGQGLLRAGVALARHRPRPLVVRGLRLQVAQDAPEARGVGGRGRALGAGEVPGAEARGVADLLVVRVRAFDGGLGPRAVEEAPADDALGLFLAAGAPPVLVAGRGARRQAQGHLSPEAQALEDLERRDEGSYACPGVRQL